MESVIQMKNIEKCYKVPIRREKLSGYIKDIFSKNSKEIHAVDNITLDIKSGEMVGYLGPNGAGKSTTIKMMTGIIIPTSGSILVNGKVPYKSRTKNAKNIGVVFGQRTQLWWDLPLVESFRILKEIYKIDDEIYNNNLKIFEELVNISELYHRTIRQMSLGQRTLCDILAAFLHDPSVVFLDEPTIGLDVSMKNKIRQLIVNLNKQKGITVILTTHDIGDVDALCNRVIIIDKGKKAYDGSIVNLRNYYGRYRTLKLLLHEETSELSIYEIEQLKKKVYTSVKEVYSDLEAGEITYENSRIQLTVNEEKIMIPDILPTILEKFQVYDLSIESISTENVLMKIYEVDKK